MIVDEARKYSLTKFSTKNGQKSIKESDHNLLILKLNLRWNSLNKTSRIEVYNFKNENNFKTFQFNTEENKELINCFEDFDNFNEACTKWLQIFNEIIRKSFKKIRIKKDKNSDELDNLFLKKESLKQKIEEAEEKETLDVIMKLDKDYQTVVEEIASICAKKNKDLVKDYLGTNTEEDEPHDQLKTWRLKKKISPKNSEDPPSAKIDSEGNLVTDKSQLENLYLKTYVDRLSPNPIPENLQEVFDLSSLLFDLRMNKSSKNISPDWTMNKLDYVLKNLKNNKARDAHGHTYELFKFGGRDLKLSLLKLFNLTKSEQIYPDILQPSNISSIFKNRGCKSNLSNDRGVFNVVKLRSILDRLSYNDNYMIIDQNMSCSNIGARKNRNIRDHLFVINAILNDINIRKIQNVDIQIMDIEKCFDKMSYKETANDLYNAGVQDDHFVLMANSNKRCQVAVRTPWGSLTERVELKEIEMQGTVPAPLKCSIQIDTLGKECIESGEGLYQYKECVNIPPLAMIDDILAVSVCSVESVKVNALIQSKVAHKNLKLGQDKCFKMHVGSQDECCPTLKLNDKIMLSSNREKYLGDILTNMER